MSRPKAAWLDATKLSVSTQVDGLDLAGRWERRDRVESSAMAAACRQPVSGWVSKAEKVGPVQAPSLGQSTNPSRRAE